LQAIIYRDRLQAGEHLASELQSVIEYKGISNFRQVAIILAIPRGGVIIGDVIASKLGIKLDIVVSRKIGAPENAEFAIGAIMPDGNYILSDVIDAFNVSKKYILHEANVQLKEIHRRLLTYRGTIDYNREFDNKLVILVDDGIATGSTLMASAEWVRNNFNCRVWIAVPVAPTEILDNLAHLADQVIVLHSPDPFIAIGRFYGIFDQVSDDQVKKIMKKYGYNPRDKVG
jgi:putative phosphoribosyl transferase